MESLQQIWEQICDYCKSKVNEVTYNAWFTLLRLKRIDGNKVILSLENNVQRKIILENFKDIIDEAVEEVLKFPVKVVIETDEDKPISPLNMIDATSQYDFTFETFIVGASNRFAHAASLAVAENENVVYNPLFIWGNSGLGKTHLLSAIATRIHENYPDKKIISITCEQFGNEFFYCLQHGKMTEFREKYRHIDVLLIDDIQFISGKESTEEEFFNTFNELYEHKKQIVIISDRPPKDITGISDRMRSRFEAGLMADIQNPEYETRVGIINRKAQMMNFNLSEEIVTYIADQVKCNIRQLEGVVKKLHAMSMIYDSITLGVAESVIRDIKREDISEPVTIQRVVNEVSKAYSVTIEDIYSKRQDAPVAHARQVAMYVIRQITEMPYKMIGQEFGGKNHATVMYSCNNIQKLCMTDDYESKLIANIIKNLTNK